MFTYGKSSVDTSCQDVIRTLLLEEIEECNLIAKDIRFSQRERFYYLSEVNRLSKILKEV